MGSAGSGVPLKKTYEMLNTKHRALIDYMENLIKQEKKAMQDINYVIQKSRTEEERQYHKGRRDMFNQYIEILENISADLYRNN